MELDKTFLGEVALKVLNVVTFVMVLILFVHTVLDNEPSEIDERGVVFTNETVYAVAPTSATSVSNQSVNSRSVNAQYVQSDGVAVQTQPTLSLDTYVKYVRDNYGLSGWKVKSNTTQNTIRLIFGEYHYYLPDARFHIKEEEFQQQWNTFTNGVYDKTQTIIADLRQNGFKGNFIMVVQDKFGEEMFVASERKWADEVLGLTGTGYK